MAKAQKASNFAVEFEEPIAIELVDDESYDEKEEIRIYFVKKA